MNGWPLIYSTRHFSVETKRAENRVFEESIGEENMSRCLQILKSLHFFKQNKKNTTKLTGMASVLVPFCHNENGDVSVIVTLRSSTISSHRNQISFPGGNEDKDDNNDAIKTATRETVEELGIKPESIKVFGCLNALPSRTNAVVYPVLSYVHLDFSNPDVFKVNPSEVGKVLMIPLKNLCKLDNWRYTYWQPNGLYTPVFRDNVFNDKEIPRIWGLTAAILHIVLTGLLPNHYHFSLPNQPFISK